MSSPWPHGLMCRPSTRKDPSADAAAMHEHLRRHQVTVGELLRWDGVPPMFAFRDPDGNGLEIVQ